MYIVQVNNCFVVVTVKHDFEFSDAGLTKNVTITIAFKVLILFERVYFVSS